MKNFWMSIISSKETNSSKRLITLIIAFHFIIASFVILFFAFYLMIYTPKGVVNIDLLNLLKTVLEYDFYIILSGLGFITGENLGQMLVERAKAVSAGVIGAVGAAGTASGGGGGDSVTDIIASVAKSGTSAAADSTGADTTKTDTAQTEEGA